MSCKPFLCLYGFTIERQIVNALLDWQKLWLVSLFKSCSTSISTFESDSDRVLSQRLRPQFNYTKMVNG
jgi:hypothetical protein